jgi:hypothetical protein
MKNLFDQFVDWAGRDAVQWFINLCAATRSPLRYVTQNFPPLITQLESK